MKTVKVNKNFKIWKGISWKQNICDVYSLVKAIDKQSLKPAGEAGDQAQLLFGRKGIEIPIPFHLRVTFVKICWDELMQP